MRRFLRRVGRAFTLVEMVVSISVLTLLVLLCTRLLNSASTIATTGNKRMDTDNQARPVLDRMAEDFSQIVKRADVDYFLKSAAGSTTTGSNDQIAFYGQVPGYYPSSGSQSPLSLVGYRVNSTTMRLERLGHGLLWNGVSTTDTPVVFLPLTIATTWPAATNMSQDTNDPVVKNYEAIGPQVFRFEYYYQLQLGDLWDQPWDNTDDNGLGHTTVSGLRDVGAIVVVIATIDPKSRVLVPDNKLSDLTGQLVDYTVYKSPGNSGKVGPQLTATWQDAVNNAVKNKAIPAAAAAGIRMYERYFYLNGKQQ
jgi:type II secretory pathway component PulJ